MDQIEDQKLQNSEKHNKFHFLKRTLQLLVSVSLFSLILCYYYGFSLFPYSFNIYFSTFLLSFFTHTLERKYMFLICNVGIIAFLAKSSVSCSSSTEMKTSSVFLNEEVPMGVGSLENVALVAEEEQKQKEEEEEGEEEEEAAVAKEAKEQEQDIWSSYGEENERESEALIAENEGKEEESVPLMKQEEGEPEAASESSTDELNKKFEEFIRKTKEELRIEAQRQLIAV